MSETTQPVRLTGLIPNSHTPCRLNCLLGDRITSLSSSGSSLSNFRGDQKNLALDPCLLLPPLWIQTSSSFSAKWIRQGSRLGSSGSGWVSPCREQCREHAGGSRRQPGKGRGLSRTISSLAHVSLSTRILCCLPPSAGYTQLSS